MGAAHSLDNQNPLEPSVLEDHQVFVGDLVLDTAARAIHTIRGMHTVKLSSNEYAILAALTTSPGRAVRREDLLSAIADDQTDPGLVDTYVQYLNRQMQEARSAATIEKVTGVGFLLRP